ncbi:hypothetical protein KUTeg_003732 [Tegillarca granosa]|uniref:Uncharacterized protein n=1 Tax=Tegillarca granosa TaxID=220873 RepID=A0ABQ9FR53_TEGGR|nr:hypothetical protein KUTeg_003732 [Tegillarca granosa]
MNEPFTNDLQYLFSSGKDVRYQDLKLTTKIRVFTDSCHLLGTNWLHRLRCLPYFHVLGIDKSGSTDLFSRIVQHPQILGNGGEINKETMWWSWKRYGISKCYFAIINEIFMNVFKILSF